MMLTFLVILVAVVTAALVLAEIFFIPGLGLMGIIGAGGFIAMEYFLFAEGMVLSLIHI